MTKQTASDTKLGLLHSRVAEVMLNALTSADTAAILLETFRDQLPTEVIAYLSIQTDVNPALLQAVTKFLKDNDITCQIAEDENMTELQQRLAEKQGRRKTVGNVVPIEE